MTSEVIEFLDKKALVLQEALVKTKQSIALLQHSLENAKKHEAILQAQIVFCQAGIKEVTDSLNVVSEEQPTIQIEN